jgi:hypothetical protein
MHHVRREHETGRTGEITPHPRFCTRRNIDAASFLPCSPSIRVNASASVAYRLSSTYLVRATRWSVASTAIPQNEPVHVRYSVAAVFVDLAGGLATLAPTTASAGTLAGLSCSRAVRVGVSSRIGGMIAW